MRRFDWMTSLVDSTSLEAQKNMQITVFIDLFDYIEASGLTADSLLNVEGGTVMLRDAMARTGYNQEEHYFFELNQKLKDQLRKDPLRIRRDLRALRRSAQAQPVSRDGSPVSEKLRAA